MAGRGTHLGAALALARSVIAEVIVARRTTTLQHALALDVRDFLRRQLGLQNVHVRSWSQLPELSVSLHDWMTPKIDVHGFDRLFAKVAADGPFRLVLRCNDWSHARYPALQLLTRYQRYQPLQPWHQDDGLAEAVAVLEGLVGSDRTKLERSFDRWCWVQRLNPVASRALQLAALFSETEDGAPGDELGAPRALYSSLQNSAIPQSELLRAAELLVLRATPNLDPDSATLRDADTLCFFNVETWRHLRSFGSDATVAEAERRLVDASENVSLLVGTTRQPAAIHELLLGLVTESVTAARLPTLESARAW